MEYIRKTLVPRFGMPIPDNDASKAPQGATSQIVSMHEGSRNLHIVTTTAIHPKKRARSCANCIHTMNGGSTSLNNKQDVSSELLDCSSLLSRMIKAPFPSAMDSFSPSNFQGLSNVFPPIPSSGWQQLTSPSDHQDLTEYVLQIIESAEEIICPDNNGVDEFVGPVSSGKKRPLPFDLLALEPTPIGPDANFFPVLKSPCTSMSRVANTPAMNYVGLQYYADQVPSQVPEESDHAFCQGGVSSGYALSNLDSTSVSSMSSQKDKQGRRFRDYEADQWTERFTELLQFKEANGHCLVPHTYPANPLLSQWVKRQRYQFKLKALGRHSTLTDDRQQMLEVAGFVWHCHQASWYEKLDALQKYQAHYGDCRVPPNYHDRSLAVWVKCQRRQWKLFRKGQRCSITKHRIDILDKMGFEWNPRGL